jgi:hypothetical protein
MSLWPELQPRKGALAAMASDGRGPVGGSTVVVAGLGVVRGRGLGKRPALTSATITKVTKTINNRFMSPVLIEGLLDSTTNRNWNGKRRPATLKTLRN